MFGVSADTAAVLIIYLTLYIIFFHISSKGDHLFFLQYFLRKFVETIANL